MMDNTTMMNNDPVLLDIKRDCERICANNKYDFAEADDYTEMEIKNFVKTAIIEIDVIRDGEA